MSATPLSRIVSPPGRGAAPTLVILLSAVLLCVPIAVCGAGLTVLDLQRNRVDSSIDVLRPGSPYARVTLANLNPTINAWFVLQLIKKDGTSEEFHLENPLPRRQRVDLSLVEGGALVLIDGLERHVCVLWPPASASPLALAKDSGRPFGDLCEGRLHLRNPVVGRRTRKEWATDLLRDRFRYGEQVTTFVKERFFRDKYRRAGEFGKSREGEAMADALHRPSPVIVDSSVSTRRLKTPDLNFAIAQANEGLVPGHWYSVEGHTGVFVSAVTPGLVPDAAVPVRGDLLAPLAPEELSALVYLVAFDLSMFDLGFSLGTEHPRVGWSDRVPEAARVPSLPGPDGFDNLAPLVRTGILSPHDVPRAAATFAGGFKRTHGAFQWGELASRNRGSHYGFIENGVVLSSLQPDLATFLVFGDGSVEMKTWRNADSSFVGRIRHARQNGVPLVERGASTDSPRPGSLVRDWARGNWSGSPSKLQRTLRAGAGIQDTEQGRFLIYGYFTAATPSAMARVFLASRCAYAMHLDMNAPEHTYLAIYRTEGSHIVVQRLVAEMAEVDPPVSGQEVPRYVGYADNRDFFYLLRRQDGGHSP